jgi:hypothetical protein
MCSVNGNAELALNIPTREKSGTKRLDVLPIHSQVALPPLPSLAETPLTYIQEDKL